MAPPEHESGGIRIPDAVPPLASNGGGDDYHDNGRDREPAGRRSRSRSPGDRDRDRDRGCVFESFIPLDGDS